MVGDHEKATLNSGRLRRFLLYYVASLMLIPQVLFVLHGILGFDFDPKWMVWLVPGVIPVSLSLIAVFAEKRQHALEEPAVWTQWAFVAAGMFAIWAGTYFMVGRFVDPSRVRYLSTFLESRIPFIPSFSLLYILLYPIFLLPFFVIRDRAGLQRLVVGNLLMFLGCSVIFLGVPVAFDRPPMPPPPHDFGTWVMSLVRGSDPAWNCLPSEHCAAAMLASLAVYEVDKKFGAFAFWTTLLIGVSTLYTKQHYVVDVIAGYGLSFGIHWTLRWSKVLQREQVTPAG